MLFPPPLLSSCILIYSSRTSKRSWDYHPAGKISFPVRSETYSMLILSHRAVIKSPSHHACCGLTSNTQAISRGGEHIFYIRRRFFFPPQHQFTRQLEECLWNLVKSTRSPKQLKPFQPLEWVLDQIDRTQMSTPQSIQKRARIHTASLLFNKFITLKAPILQSSCKEWDANSLEIKVLK